MAPRRGGGGGGGYGRGGSSSQCSDNDAFASDWSKGSLAIVAIFLGVDLLILTLWVMKRARNSQMKQVVRWWNFGLALLLSMLSKILYIIALCLAECGIISAFFTTYAGINLASSWFGMISDLLLLSILIITICGVLYQHAGASIPKIVSTAAKWIHVGFLVLITIIGVASTALASDIQANIDDYDPDALDKARSSNQLAAAYWFLILFAVVAGILRAGHGVWGVGKRGVKSGSLKFLLPILFVSWLVYIILRLVYIVGFTLGDRMISPSSSLGLTAVQYFFIAAIFITYLYIASARAVTTIPTQDPVPAITEPKVHNGGNVGPAAPAFPPYAAPPATQAMGYPQHQNGTTYPPQQVPGAYGYAQPQPQQYMQQGPSPPPQQAYEVPTGQQYAQPISTPSPVQRHEAPAGQQQYGGQEQTHRYG